MVKQSYYLIEKKEKKVKQFFLFNFFLLCAAWILLMSNVQYLFKLSSIQALKLFYQPHNQNYILYL